MKHSYLVSCLMTVYNCENVIERALKSMAAQTYTNIEFIIVIEYGCTDKTVEICQKFALEFPNVVLITNQCKLGVAESLNVGLGACKGEFIARMDADDYSYPSRIEKQVQFLIDNPHIDLLGTNARILKYQWERDCFEDEYWYKEIPGEWEIPCRLLFGTCLCHPTILFRSRIIREWGYQYPPCLAEDYAFFAEMMMKVKMRVLPEVLLDYYINGNNLTYSSYHIVRPDSERISRQTILRELHVDTSGYHNSLFGWRYYDPTPENIQEFLCQTIELFIEIENRNNILNKFPCDELSKVLFDEWELTKWLIRPYANVRCIERDYHLVDLEELSCAYSNPESVIFYGTGEYCEMVLSQQSELLESQIKAFCDSDVRKHDSVFMGKPVIGPEQLRNFDIDAVVISSPKYYTEIRRFLKANCLLNKNIGIIDVISFLQTKPYRQYLKNLSKICGNTKKIYLFCAPDYGNLGDHGIAYAEHQYIWKHCRIQPIEITYKGYRESIAAIKRHIKKDDLILITGGGFMGSAWFHLECQAREVVYNFPDNPVIIMPQTFYWEYSDKWSEEMERSRAVYEQHRNLTICARDKESLRIVQSVYSQCNVILVPDMVLSCQWDSLIDKEAERKGAFICLKENSDKESILGESEKKRIIQMAYNNYYSVTCGNTSLDHDVPVVEREKELRNKLKEFSKARIVITDRLHGMLFSLIMNTPCIVLNNFNHKLKSNYEWIYDVPFIKFAENIDEMDQLMIELQDVDTTEFSSDDFAERFITLEKLLLEKIKGEELT